jgi:hypothetical protein
MAQVVTTDSTRRPRIRVDNQYLMVTKLTAVGRNEYPLTPAAYRGRVNRLFIKELILI